MKPSEQSRGVPLAGFAVKVTNGFFLIGLSASDADRDRNLQLLKERSWFDIPVVYNNNRRAILALEKGNPGERAFEEAFKAWEQTSADLAPPSRPAAAALAGAYVVQSRHSAPKRKRSGPIGRCRRNIRPGSARAKRTSDASIWTLRASSTAPRCRASNPLRHALRLGGLAP
jgi:hypothetical protein